VENKTAWFVGSGLASLAGATFLIRDGQMAGEKITILEELKLPGGALDGLNVPEKGFVIRGGRELEDHMECEWDLFRSIPSLEIEGASVLDEFRWVNKSDPNYSLQRLTQRQGQDVPDKALLTLTTRGRKTCCGSSSPPVRRLRTSASTKSWARISSRAISGSFGAPRSPSRNGIPPWS